MSGVRCWQVVGGGGGGASGLSLIFTIASQNANNKDSRQHKHSQCGCCSPGGLPYVRPVDDQGCRVTRLRCRWIIGYAAATGAHSCRISSCRYTEQSRYTHTPPSSAAAAAAGASLVVRSLCRRRVTLRVCVCVRTATPTAASPCHLDCVCVAWNLCCWHFAMRL